MPRFPAASSRNAVLPARAPAPPRGAAGTHAPLKTQSVRTSLIDAEWDWIARRMVNHDGNWRLTSVVHPSLAVVSYAQPKTLTWPALQVAAPALPPEVARTKSATPSTGSAPEQDSTPTSARARFQLGTWKRGLALLAAAALGLLIGAALPRLIVAACPLDPLEEAGSTAVTNAAPATTAASAAPAAPTGVTPAANGSVTVSPAVVTASAHAAPPSPGAARSTRKRSPRRGVVPPRSLQRRFDGSDNPY